jgi:uncharacterized protein (TIGR03437 family)
MLKKLCVLPMLLLAACSAPKKSALSPPVPTLPARPPAYERADASGEKSGAEMLRSFTGSRAPAGSEIPVERYLAARDHIARMQQYSLAEGRLLPQATPPQNLGGWAPVGPAGVGGRTRSLLIHPTNPNIMYAGAVSGGVWKTVDGGNSWSALTINFELPFICTLAMDPANPNIIYAGTGESFGVSYQGIRGLGILKTTDGGTTWARLSATTTPDFYFVNKIKISPQNSLHLYAATSTGVFRSLDGGATWTLALAAPPPQFSASVPGCQDVAIRTDTPTDYGFASCVVGFRGTGGIWRNTDAAGSGVWTNVQSLPGVVRIGLALAPSSQSTIFAITAVGDNGANSYINALGAVLRSTSNGDPGSWQTMTSNTNATLLNTLLLNYPVFSCGGPSADSQKVGQGAYDLAIEVDPTNPNNVWVGGVDVFRSNDGGANWGIAGFFDASGTSAIHSDQHQVVFHPQWNGASNQTLYVVNDGGIWRTANASAPVVTGQNALCVKSDGTYTGAAIAWTPLNNGYLTTQFYHGSVYPGGTYIGGTQDNGSYRGNAAQSAPGWNLIGGGDGAVWRYDPLDSSVFYGENGSLSLARFTLGGRIFQAVTNGITEFTATITPYILDPTESRRLYLGALSLWRSENRGDTWVSVSPPGKDYVYAIAVSPADPRHVVYGNQSGDLWWTTSALTATPSAGWSFSRPRNGTVSAVAFHPTDPNMVFAAYSTFDSAPSDNHMYKSVDSGRTWTGIDGAGATGLPDLPVSHILIDPLNPSTIYLGTDLGVFVSTDAGASWAHDSSTFANTIINTLALDRGSGGANLYAFTFGRGVWRVALGGSNAGSPCLYSVSPTLAPSDAAGALNYVTVTTAAGCAWSAQVVSGSVRLLPPAAGVGTGRVYYTLDPNDFSNPHDPGVFTVQGQTIHVMTQPAADQPASNDTVATAHVIPALPYHGAQYGVTFTSDPLDPFHTCTGSRDFQTSWWSYTAPANGYVTVTTRSVRIDGTPGNGGVTLTAYRVGALTNAGELGCFTVPRSAFGPSDLFPDEGGFQLAVQAGTTYLVEVSATTNNANFEYLTLVSSAGPASLTVGSSAANLSLSSKQQFSAQTVNLLTPVVRWSISPAVGFIDQNGVYTAPSALAAGATAAFVTVTAVSIADSSKQANANITIAGAPVAVAAVTNAASFLADAVSPGEMVTLFGNGLGPATLAGAQLNPDGTVASTVAQTQVLFDGVAAPIIYVAAGQTTVMVPYSVSGRTSTQVVVIFQGQRSAPFTVPVVASAPGIFALPDGKQGAILNYTANGGTVLNTAQTPAPAGTFIAIFATGEGQTSPPGVDGRLNNGPTLPAPVLPVSLTIGGQPAQVSYAGAAPQGVAGFMQVNAVIPAGLTPGAQPVVLRVGDNISSAIVTVWVK